MKKILPIIFTSLLFWSCTTAPMDYYTVQNNSSETVIFDMDGCDDNPITLPAGSRGAYKAYRANIINIQGSPRVSINYADRIVSFSSLSQIPVFIVNKTELVVALSESTNRFDTISVPANTTESSPLNSVAYSTSLSFTAKSATGFPVKVSYTYKDSGVYVVITL